MNIGNPGEMTVLQFAKAILEMTGSKSEIDFRPLPVDDPKVRQPDIGLARKLLAWEPKVSFTEGIEKTVIAFVSFLQSRLAKTHRLLLQTE